MTSFPASFRPARTAHTLGLTLWTLLSGCSLAQTPSTAPASPSQPTPSQPTSSAAPALLWSKNLKVVGSLALSESDLIFIGTDSKLHLTSSSGTERWAYALGDLGRAQPLVTRSRIYAVAYDDSVHALTPAGKLEWKYRSDADLFASPALLEDGGVLIASARGTVTALSSLGKKRWEFRAGGGVFSSPILSSDGQTIYFGAQDGKLYALSSEGKLKWTFQASSTLFSSAALDLDGTLYIGSSDRSLYAVAPDGTLRWRFRTEGFVNASPIITLEGLIVVGSFDKRLYALNRAGALIWKRELDGPIAASAVGLEGGRLVVGTYAGSLYGLSSAGEVLWRSPQGSKLDTSAVVDAAGVLYVGSAGGTLSALKLGALLAQGPWPHYRNSVSGLGRGLSSAESAALRPKLDLKALTLVPVAAVAAVTPPPVTPPPAKPPVTPPVTPPATPPATPPVTPPVTPPATPPTTPPPATPPVTPPPATPPVTPPATPPVTPPAAPPSTPPVTPAVTPALSARPVPIQFRRLSERLQVRDGAVYLPAVELLQVIGYRYSGVQGGKAVFEGRLGSGGLSAYQDLGSDTLYAALEDLLRLPGLSAQWVSQTGTLWLKAGDREVYFGLETGKLERALSLPAVIRPR